MKYLLFSGSLRKDSLNRKLIHVASEMVRGAPGSEVVIADLKTLALPVYDGDIETAGIPSGVKELAAMIASCEALIISSPEYNSSIAGSLKNAIDWLSRVKPNPFEKKPVLLLGASPGALGSVRALGITRAPLEVLGAYVYPGSFGLAKAHEAFEPTGQLIDKALEQRLQGLFQTFSQFAASLNKGMHS